MLAHYHGQIWNAAEPARSLGVSEPTVRRYLDILSGVFMARQLLPWHANLKKRQVKAAEDLFPRHRAAPLPAGDPFRKRPAGPPEKRCVLGRICDRRNDQGDGPDEAYYWATHSGAEIDLVLVKDGRLLGVECKRMDAPRMTPSMGTALKDLKLEQIAVVYPGKRALSPGRSSAGSAAGEFGRG